MYNTEERAEERESEEMKHSKANGDNSKYNDNKEINETNMVNNESIAAQDMNQSSDETQHNKNEHTFHHKFKQIMPKPTYNRILEFSNKNYKFTKLVNYWRPNIWIIEGEKDARKFRVKIYHLDTLASYHRFYYYINEKSITDDISKGVLKHENIVKIWQVIEYPDNSFFYMDYAPITALEKLMRSVGPLDQQFTQTFTKQILKALEYLHLHGIANRNIKLDDILVFESNLVQICDFTCAMRCVKDNKVILDNAWVGTQEYMSPETLERVLHDPRVSDVWQLGICLFLIVYGNFPFGCGSKIDSDHGRDRMLNQQLSRQYNIPASIQVSDECETMYRQLMTPHFPSRPSSSQALMNPWLNDKTSVSY